MNKYIKINLIKYNSYNLFLKFRMAKMEEGQSHPQQLYTHTILLLASNGLYVFPYYASQLVEAHLCYSFRGGGHLLSVEWSSNLIF